MTARRQIKAIAGRALVAAGVAAWGERRHRQSICGLAYHNIIAKVYVVQHTTHAAPSRSSCCGPSGPIEIRLHGVLTQHAGRSRSETNPRHQFGDPRVTADRIARCLQPERHETRTPLDRL